MARFPFPQRVVLVLLLTVVLAAPAVVEAQPGPRTEDPQVGFVTTLISALRVQFWSLLTRSWEKEGCGIDPNGTCKAGIAGSGLSGLWEKAGCIIDPNGGCVPDPGSDAGTTGQKAGCGIDPHGGCGD
jgi:hypothetical protein